MAHVLFCQIGTLTIIINCPLSSHLFLSEKYFTPKRLLMVKINDLRFRSFPKLPFYKDLDAVILIH